MSRTTETVSNHKTPKSSASSQSEAILILGMHRSGTSALTRVVNLLGAQLPKTLMGASEANKTGHWESLRLVELNEQILLDLDQRWDDWRKIDTSLLGDEKREDYLKQITQAVREEYPKKGLLVIKDPRICRLLDLYLPGLEAAAIKPKAVMAYRNPIDVARSLNKRDGISIEIAQLHWLRHIVDAEHATRYLKRSFIDYDRLLASPISEIERIGSELGAFKPAIIKAHETEISEFLDPSAASFKDGKALLQGDDRILDMVKEVYRVLTAFSASGENRSGHLALTDVRHELNRLSRGLELQLKEMEQDRLTQKREFVQIDRKYQLVKGELDTAQQEVSSKQLLLEDQAKKLEQAKKSRAAEKLEYTQKLSQLKDTTKTAEALKRESDRELSRLNRQHQEEQALQALRIERLADDLGAKKQEVEALERQKTKIEQTVQDYDALKLAHSRKQDDLEALKTLLADAKADQLRLSKKIETAEQENALLKHDVFKLSKETQAKQDIEAQLAELKDELKTQKRALSNAKKTQARQAEARDSAKQEAKSLKATNIKLSRDLTSTEQKNALIEHDMAAYAQALAEKEGEFDTLVSTLQDVKLQLAESLSTGERLQNTLSDQRIEAEGLQSRIDTITAEKQHDVAVLTHEINIAKYEGQRAVADLKAELDGIKKSASWRLSKPLRWMDAWRTRRREKQLAKRVLRSGLFDADYYATYTPEFDGSSLTPIQHFLRVGGPAGRNPSTLFDAHAYLQKHPDVKANGDNPLVHYLLRGAVENRAVVTPANNLTVPAPKWSGARNIIPLGMTPLNQLTVEEQGAWGAVMQSTGNDPHLELNLARDFLEPGYYCLEGSHPRGGIPFQNAVMYVDSGKGWSDDESVHLSMAYSGAAWSALIKLPKGCRRLRFDPLVSPGKISIANVRLRRLHALNYYQMLIRRISMVRLKNPELLIASVGKIIRALRSGGLTQLRTDLEKTHSLEGRRELTYEDWITSYDTLSEADLAAIARRMEAMPSQPKISIAMPVYNTPIQLLRDCIDSVRAQIYPNWELCIANDKSPDPEVRRVLNEYAKKDARIKVVHRDENGHISKATNSALELVTGDWIALLDHDDLIAPHALYHVAEAIHANPNARLFYSDEDKIDLDNRRHDPYFKCDWNYHLFLSHNLITHLGVYDRKLIDEIEGFRVGFEGAQDWDLALRCVQKLDRQEIVHIPFILYHWRVMPGSTALAADEKPYALIAAENAVSEFLDVRKVDAEVEPIGIGLHVKYRLPKKPPLVSILIPTRNAEDLVRQCIESIDTLTTYPNYEIILVDNGSDDKKALAYFKSLADAGTVKLIRDDRPFNYSALNNGAAEQCSGEVICLLNNDIEVISPDWLEEMVSTALQPGVGAVGAMLYYPDDRIQHAGVVMGLGGMAGHVHALFPRGTFGYVGRAALKQEFSAVTAACLVVQKAHFELVDGLNENDLTVAYNDVDLCLKLQAEGLQNVWTPKAELYHHESATRGSDMSGEKLVRFEKEKGYMRAQWSHILKHDPAYSPNLTADFANFAIAFPPRVTKPWDPELS